MESDILLERKHFEENDNDKRTRISGTLLEDALYKRNPDWIKERVDIYRFRHGTIWRTVVWLAFSLWIASTILYCPYAVASFSAKVQLGNVALEIVGMIVLLADMAIKIAYRGLLKTIQKWWEIVFLISVFLMLVDMLLIRARVGFPWSRMFQPFVLFCIMPRVRNSAVSTMKLLPDVFPVLVLEWISILVFSCLAVVLFRTNDNTEVFFTLSRSLLAMFELSTTVTNPDVWLYVYDRYPFSTLFFISFLVLHLFLLHNIVLAVIRKGFNVQTRVSVMQEREWREDAIRMSFRVLEPDKNGQILTGTLTKVLKFIRPHYSTEKITMLLACVSVYRLGLDSESDRKNVPDIEESNTYPVIEWNSFKEGIINAVDLRLYSVSRECTPMEWQRYILNAFHIWNIGFLLWGCMEPMAIIYHRYFWKLMIVTTIVSCVPRSISLVYPGFMGPWKRLNVIVLVFSIGGLIFPFIFMDPGGWIMLGHENIRNLRVCTCLLMTGRCLDTFYILSQFKCFRDLTLALGKAIPYAQSQLIVILSIMHMFVFVGMGLWAGKLDKSTPEFASVGKFYYKLNFNTYPESMVTLFQLLAMNNWNVVAHMYAELNSSWVYVYFIAFILFAVTIVMNVLAAIAIDAFVNEVYNHPETTARLVFNNADVTTKDTTTKPIPRNISYGSLTSKNPDINNAQLISSDGHSYTKGTRRRRSLAKIIMEGCDGLEEGGFSHVLLASFALGLGHSAGFQISTAYVRHNGEITSPPHVYLESKEFTELVKFSIGYAMTPGTKRKQSPVSLEASFLINLFYEKIRKAMNFIVSLALTTTEYLYPAETHEEFPHLVHTERIDIGDSVVAEITCTVVNYEDSNLTILYIANRQCIGQ